MPRHPLLLLGLASLLLSTACNRAHQRAIERAEAARARGDMYDAALSYRDACTADPSDEDSCKLAVELAAKESARHLEKARSACATCDVDECDNALVHAAQLTPQVAEIDALRETCERKHAQRCEALAGPTLDRALAKVRCLEVVRQRLPSARYFAVVQAARKDAAALLIRVADDSSAKGLPEARFLALSGAACLAPSSDLAQALEPAKEAALTAAALPMSYEVRLTGHGVPGEVTLCQTATPRLPIAARCDTPKAAGLALDVKVEALVNAPAYSNSQEILVQRYQSGTRQMPNPAYAEGLRRAEQARAAFHSVESETLVAKADCETAQLELDRAGGCASCPQRRQQEYACNRFETLRQVYNQRAQELQDAQRQAEWTPATLEEPVFSDFQYPMTHHRWTSRYQASFVAVGLRGRADFKDADDFAYLDDEHPGFQPAGVVVDPRQDPSPSFFAQSAMGRLVDRFVEIAHDEARHRGSLRLAACGPAGATPQPSWLACWFEGVTWSGTLADGAALLRALTPQGEPPTACF